MRERRLGIAGLLCVLTAAGCTTNKSIANISTPPATLTMAVGTINDPNASLTTGGVTLNVVSSFRNALGNSAYQKPGTPTLTGPSGAIGIQPNVAACLALFSYGQFPTCNGVAGAPPAYNPPSAIGGYATGFIVTNAPATAGAYALNTVVTVNGANVTYQASATLPASPTVLGNEGAPTFVSDSAGGGTFTISQPAGVTESLITVFDSSFNTLASLKTTSGTAVLPPGSLAAGSYNALVTGADYPLVEAGPPANVQASPTLTGTNGTSDLTVSAVVGITE